jgi:hypothetical protein
MAGDLGMYDVWENNIKMDLREMGCDSIDWVYLAQDGI